MIRDNIEDKNLENISSEIAIVKDDSQTMDKNQLIPMEEKKDPDNEFQEESDYLLKSPIIPTELYDLLPKILKEGSEMFPSQRERDVFLTSAITILSGCFPSVHGIYDRKKIYANLFSFIIAPPSSGKGSLTFAKDLAQEIHNKLTNPTSIAENLYSTDSASSSLSMLYIPGNISAAALISLLSENGGVGIICETEADSMSNSLKQDWGSFSDLLRKAFHHETVSYARKKNNEFIEIKKPRLSVSLSGTPDQVPALIKSINDGLFSRFIFYIFRNTPKWKNVSPDKSLPVYDVYMEKLQNDIKTVYEYYNGKEYSFDLTIIQWMKFNAQYEKTLRDSVTFISTDTSSIIMRLALIQFRVAMVLSILRNYEKGIPGITIDCDDLDYGISEILCDVYLQHAILVYKIMTKQLNTGLEGNIEKFFNSLPVVPFKRKEAVIIGVQIGIASRTVSKYLKILLENKFLNQAEPQGVYERVINN